MYNFTLYLSIVLESTSFFQSNIFHDIYIVPALSVQYTQTSPIDGQAAR